MIATSAAVFLGLGPASALAVSDVENTGSVTLQAERNAQSGRVDPPAANAATSSRSVDSNQCCFVPFM
jgi:hypothetical protein